MLLQLSQYGIKYIKYFHNDQHMQQLVFLIFNQIYQGAHELSELICKVCTMIWTWVKVKKKKESKEWNYNSISHMQIQMLSPNRIKWFHQNANSHI